jgi:hypothetical protein
VKLTTRILESLCLDHGETLARFGEARLVRQLSGRIELLGGSPGDRAAAREWCSLFMHEAVISTHPASGKTVQPLVSVSF